VRSAQSCSWVDNDSRCAPADDAVSADAPLRVLVAGGGLGGLFAAISLRNAGKVHCTHSRMSLDWPRGPPGVIG
jgi:thioredoxin reductase